MNINSLSKVHKEILVSIISEKVLAIDKKRMRLCV